MVQIIPYSSNYHGDFRQLNLEWLEKYGLVESHDLEVLDDPEGTLISRGGYIYLAIFEGRVVGTAGLWKENSREYELVKMAVRPDYRGRGISKLLLEQCLHTARELGAHKVFLFSNSQLKTALRLYEKYGFRTVENTNSPFVTADVKMALEL